MQVWRVLFAMAVGLTLAVTEAGCVVPGEHRVSVVAYNQAPRIVYVNTTIFQLDSRDDANGTLIKTLFLRVAPSFDNSTGAIVDNGFYRFEVAVTDGAGLALDSSYGPAGFGEVNGLSEDEGFRVLTVQVFPTELKVAPCDRHTC